MAGSTGVHDTVVNQLLSKIDGVEQLNNILVIGKTLAGRMWLLSLITLVLRSDRCPPSSSVSLVQG